MSNSYTHDLVDATAQLMEEYAHNIRKLVRLEHGDRITISVEYEKVNGASSQVLAIVFRDEDGDFFFNEHLVGDLNAAMEFYAMACAPVIKEAAIDEHGADRLEDVCRDFVDEMKATDSSEETDFDLRQSPSEEGLDNDTVRHSIFSDGALAEMIQCFPSGVTEEENTNHPSDDDDDEIIEVYHGGELVNIASAWGSAPTAASHPENEPEEA